MKKTGFALSPEQFSALVKFAVEHGRTWKQQLNAYWANGRDAQAPMGALLRQIRNEAGPSWLNGFNFITARIDYRGWMIRYERYEPVTGIIIADRLGLQLHEGSVEGMLKQIDDRIARSPASNGV